MTGAPLTRQGRSRLASAARLLSAFLLIAAIAAVGGLATAPQIPGWYATLAKPAFTPPNTAFPIVWPILYALIAISLWRLWDSVPPSPARKRALSLFAVNLALNFLWSPVFFGLHALRAGFVIIVLMIATLAALIWRSARLDRLAAALLVPYLLWICYAAALNGAIAALNS